MELVENSQRFQCIRLGTDDTEDPDDGADIVKGLAAKPKTLPCRYFYDAQGSQLFERICDTPEYYPTRTERGILVEHARDIAALTGPCELVELGSGSAAKTRHLLEAYAQTGETVHFAPIDVSESILTESSRALVSAFDSLTIRGFSGTYEQALEALHPAPAPVRMFIFLGSTIGNFTESQRRALITKIRDAMMPGDYFLLGLDRHKDTEVLEAAYNDAEGLTASFNKNILEHLNRRFNGNFDTRRFAHRAFYDREAHRIEMHLESLDQQTADLGDLGVTANFENGETVRTEISRKFDIPEISGEMAALGLEKTAIWSDAKEWFSLILFRHKQNGQNGAGATRQT